VGRRARFSLGAVFDFDFDFDMEFALFLAARLARRVGCFGGLEEVVLELDVCV
jgi:hypothetical protein